MKFVYHILLLSLVCVSIIYGQDLSQEKNYNQRIKEILEKVNSIDEIKKIYQTADLNDKLVILTAIVEKVNSPSISQSECDGYIAFILDSLKQSDNESVLTEKVINLLGDISSEKISTANRKLLFSKINYEICSKEMIKILSLIDNNLFNEKFFPEIKRIKNLNEFESLNILSRDGGIVIYLAKSDLFFYEIFKKKYNSKDPAIKYTRLVDDLSFIANADARKILISQILSEEILPSIKDNLPGQKVGIYAIIPLSKLYDDFPVKNKKFYQLTHEDFYIAREWAKKYFTP